MLIELDKEKYAKATNTIGSLFADSRGGVAVDKIKPGQDRAFKMYLFAAKMGTPFGQNNVGAMLKHGVNSAPPDRVKAYAWLMLAKENGSELAQKDLQDFKEMFSKKDQALGMEHPKEIRGFPVRDGDGLKKAGDMRY